MEVRKIDTDKIIPNPDQPRQYFNKEDLQDLADSMKEFGQLQPIKVTPNNGNFQIVWGERRWRAAKLGKIPKMDCIVEKMDKITQEVESLIENVHREDLDITEKGTKAYEIFQLNGIDMGSKELAENIASIEHKEIGLGTTDKKIMEICKKINKKMVTIRIWLEAISISPEIKKAEIKKPKDEKIAGKTLARLSTIEDENLQKKVHAKIEEQGMGQMEASKLITKIKQVDERTRETMLKKGVKIDIRDREEPAIKIEITQEDIDDMEDAMERDFEQKQAMLDDPHAQKTKQLFENWRANNSLKGLINSGLLINPFNGKPAFKELIWKSNPNETIMDGVAQAKKNYEDHVKKQGGNKHGN